MKKLKLTKVIASLLVVASVLALNPIGASAEWKQESNGWWRYKEGNSYTTGWKQIDGKWYCFNGNGYMFHDLIIDGYYLNSDGVWDENSNKVGVKDYTKSKEIQAYVNLLNNPKVLKEKYNFNVDQWKVDANKSNDKISNKSEWSDVKILNEGGYDAKIANECGADILIVNEYIAYIADIDGDGVYEAVVYNEVIHGAAKTSILTYKNGEVQLVNDDFLGVFCSGKEKVIIASDHFNGTGNGGVYKLENGKLNKIHSYNITLTSTQPTIIIDGQSVTKEESNTFFKQYIDATTTRRRELPIVFIN